jgi:hypothetical protein
LELQIKSGPWWAALCLLKEEQPTADDADKSGLKTKKNRQGLFL